MTEPVIENMFLMTGWVTTKIDASFQCLKKNEKMGKVDVVSLRKNCFFIENQLISP